MLIHFEINEDKAVETLTWLANNQPGIDAFHVSKVLYYAEKEHLNRYGRPILGDAYIRMQYGPVPSYVYRIIRREAHPTVLQKASEAVEIRGEWSHLHPLRRPNMDFFSRTDIECLQKALKKYGTRDFGTLSRISHKEAAWQNAPENGQMDYEDMIEPNERQEEIIEHLKEHSRQIAL